MANLLEIAQLVFNQIQPQPNDETAIQLEEVIASSKLQYAWEIWRLSKEEKAQEGVFNIPSSLLTQVELPVKENTIDISDLDILRSLTNDKWLVNIGGLISPCKYIASNVNLIQLLQDDDSLDDTAKPYLVIGNEIMFPRGTHANPLKIIYANTGATLDERVIQIEDSVGAIVRTKLLDIYLRKGVVDETNNSSSNS